MLNSTLRSQQLLRLSAFHIQRNVQRRMADSGV
jgi:hypothetical protein